MVCDVDVAVLSSSPFVREGLSSLLNRSRFRVVSASAATSEATDPAEDQVRPALILAALEDASGFEALRSLQATYPEAKLVVFGRAAAPERLPRDLCLSAQAVLDYGISREALLSVLEVLMAGVTVQSAGLFSWLFAQPGAAWPATADHQPILVGQSPAGQSGTGAPLHHQLSNRELDVLRSLAEGTSNKLIARKYDLAEATVKVHVKAIMRKLGTQNRTQAAIWAREHGIQPASTSGSEGQPPQQGAGLVADQQCPALV
ncbi:response regulator transcription factor [Methylobacterium nigriterrae]|uniref:response regulator transcription factor n=1 Tax=Methylobacterium nigriterrae TaxID=3127512 RepID=UPI0030134B17